MGTVLLKDRPLLRVGSSFADDKKVFIKCEVYIEIKPLY